MSGQPLIWWDWIGRNLGLIGDRLAEHVWLTVLAVAIGFLISFPLGVAAHRNRRLYGPVTFVTGVLYTIPSLALFVLLFPLTGFSTLTVEIALVSYTLLILIRNIVAGLDQVPEDAKEAARGMGYTERQLLWRVELPLALPVIVAGVRIAAVTTIGLVTVAALLGKGGLGSLMLQGFRRALPRTAVLVGLVLSVALAVAADGLLLLFQRWRMPWARGRKVAAT